MAWFVMQGEKARGPFDASQLKGMAREGQITAETLISKSNAGPWVAARNVKGLLTHQIPAASATSRETTAGKSQATGGMLPSGRSSQVRGEANATRAKPVSASKSSETSKQKTDAKEGRRLPVFVRLALNWYRIPTLFWVIFYGCSFVLMLIGQQLGKSSNDLMWNLNASDLMSNLNYWGRLAGMYAVLLALLAGLLTAFLRFYIADYCLPSPEEHFYVRVKGGNVRGPCRNDEVDSLLATNQSDFVAVDAAGPFFFWMQAMVDEAKERNTGTHFWKKFGTDGAAIAWFFFELLPQLRKYRWYRVFRFVAWSVIAVKLLRITLYNLGISLPIDSFLNVEYFYKIYPVLACFLIADIVLTATSSSLARSYVRQIIRNRNESKRQKKDELNRARDLAQEKFLNSGLFDQEPRISGLLIQIEGVSCQNTSTDTAAITFRKAGISLSLPGGVSKTIPAEKVKSVVVGGRGNFTSSQDSMWAGGGIGFGGAIQGALNAAALNMVTSLLTREDQRECIVVLKWQSGELVLLNQDYEPAQAWGQIRRVTETYTAQE
jgi:hypothetical protein